MPKKQTFSFVVPGSPEDVALRLKQRTRWRLFPFQGSVITPTDRPLAGRVGKDRFAVAVNKRDWWTLMQAVASGELEATAGGTRVTGEAGMPTWVTWQLRLATIAALIAGAGGVGAIATGASGFEGPAMMAVFMSVVLIATVFGIGLNVKNADEQVPELVAQLEDAALGDVEPEMDLAIDTEAVEQARARQQAAQAASRQQEG